MAQFEWKSMQQKKMCGERGHRRFGLVPSRTFSDMSKAAKSGTAIHWVWGPANDIDSLRPGNTNPRFSFENRRELPS